MNSNRESLVLAYHSVSPDWPSPLAVRPEALAEQVASLLGRGLRPATFAELTRSQGADRLFAVTFDDGYAALEEHALPVLSELGVPGTVFVPTAFPGSGRPLAWEGIEEWGRGSHRGELRPLDWDQLGALLAVGWEVGSHSRTHPHLPRLGDDQLAEELEGSREDLRRELGLRTPTLAYPYGDADARVCAAARSAGYTAAASMSPRGTDRLCWPRIGIYPIDGPHRFRLKTSDQVRVVRASRMGEVLESGRYRLPAVEIAPFAESTAALVSTL